jgi:lysine-specific demethylase 8
MARLALLLCGVLCVCRGSEPPPGHLLPLGSHTEPELVARLPAMPSSLQFHTEFVAEGRPVVLEGVLNSTRLLEAWGDDGYLRERFGAEEVSVEHKKKENRSETGFLTTMADYLDRYRSEDIYLVTPMVEAMQEEWLLPPFLLCGGFAHNLVFSYIWFSSGGTRSVLHTDSFHNLHCLVSGVKEFLLIEPRFTETIGPEHSGQGFYNIDVDQVDMLSHPGLASVPWHQAVVWPGDCLFLPHAWVHHVRSHGRNFGVNLWWSTFQYDPAGCGGELPEFAPLAEYGLVPELQLKQGLMDHADEDGVIRASDIHQTLRMREQLASLELDTVLEVKNQPLQLPPSHRSL